MPQIIGNNLYYKITHTFCFGQTHLLFFLRFLRLPIGFNRNNCKIDFYIKKTFLVPKIINLTFNKIFLQPQIKIKTKD